MKASIPYQAPVFRMNGFNCPNCHAYSAMTWAEGCANWYGGGHTSIKNVDFAQCSRCDSWSVWYEEEMIYPREISVESPNADLPESVRQDYEEAALILQDSPRGAAALLRLAIQKLCDHLVEGTADLNGKIGTLVKDGLDQKIQKALDAVRVIGNEAVHPGQINLNDTPQVARQLFKLVNLIGRRMITEPAEVDVIYNSLPQDKREGIDARDKPKK